MAAFSTNGALAQGCPFRRGEASYAGSVAKESPSENSSALLGSAAGSVGAVVEGPVPGGPVGKPTPVRKRWMLPGSVTIATSFNRPPHFSQCRTSIFHVRFSSSAHGMYRPRRRAGNADSVANRSTRAESQ